VEYVRAPLVLLASFGIACAAGSSRNTGATSLSIGDGSDGSATGSTGSTDGVTSTTSGEAESTAATSVDATSGIDGSSDEGTTTAPPVSCADDESACDAWFLPRGASAWEAVTIGGPAALAPNGPVLAAFDIEAEHIAFLITADELVHVDLDQRAWVSKTMIADRLPELNIDVFAAYSIPGSPESVTITGSDVAFLYNYDAGADSFAFDQSTVFGAEWNGPAAPDETKVREMWLDLTNADGWCTNDVSEICNNGSGPVGPHVAVVTDTEVYVEDAGYCFDFFPPVAYAAYGPFALTGAPAADRIGGIAYNETTGLVVFAAGR
jgi:hypothetical protein